MKLKLVVASMSLLGLVSCPVFAATTATSTTAESATATTATATTVKHKRHHKMMAHHVKHHETLAQERREERVEAERISYKGEMSPVEVCSVSQTSIILDEATQNLGRALPNPCNPGWYNRIMVSGGMNVDLGKWGNRNADFQGENYNRFSLNDVYVNIGANINDWTKAFASISYSNTSSTGGSDSDHYGYSSVYNNNTLSLEQAYFTVGNFDVSPIFVQIGKQFTDFSRYEIHPITRSMTQVLSEALPTSGKLGFIVPMGFHGSLYIFDDPIKKIGKTSRTTDYGATLGYDQPGDQFGWDLGVGYVYNMMAAEDVAHGVSNFTGGGYNSRKAAAALYADINSGPFSVNARWTGAVQRFNPSDLPKHGFADEGTDDVINADASGAKPWAVGIQAGYGFEMFGGRSNNVFLGYQQSGEAVGIGLPKNRWLVGYGIELWKKTNLGLEWDHDTDYSTGNGGSGNTDNLVTLRAGVQF